MTTPFDNGEDFGVIRSRINASFEALNRITEGGEISLEAFSPSAGTADNANALDAAVAYMTTRGGGTIILPRVYTISRPIPITGDNITIRGRGWDTGLRAADVDAAYGGRSGLLVISGTACAVENLSLDGRSPTTDGNIVDRMSGLYFQHASRDCRVRDVLVKEFTRNGVSVCGEGHVLENVRAENCNRFGVMFGDTPVPPETSTPPTRNCISRGLTIDTSRSGAIEVNDGVDHIVIDGFWFRNTPLTLIRLREHGYQNENNLNVTFRNGWCRNNPAFETQAPNSISEPGRGGGIQLETGDAAGLYARNITLENVYCESWQPFWAEGDIRGLHVDDQCEFVALSNAHPCAEILSNANGSPTDVDFHARLKGGSIGLSVTNATRTRIGSTITDAQRNGIRIQGGDDHQIIGAHIEGCGLGGTGSELDGILVSSTNAPARVRIVNSTVREGDGNLRFAVAVPSATSALVVVGNTFEGFSEAEAIDGAAVTAIIANNFGADTPVAPDPVADPVSAPVESSVTATSLAFTFASLSNATGYDARYSTDETNWTLVEGIGASPATITGLTAETGYYVQYRGKNGLGESAWSASSAVITTAAAPASNVIVFDDFNRADEDLAVSADWRDVTAGGSFTDPLYVRSNKVRSLSNNGVALVSPAVGNDQYIEADVTRTDFSSDNQGVHLILRSNDAGTDCYRFLLRSPSGGNCTWQLQKRVSDSDTELATGSITDPGTAFTQRFEVSGSGPAVLKGFINGTQVTADVSDSSSPYTSGRPGFRINVSSTDRSWVQVDDVEVGEL